MKKQYIIIPIVMLAMLIALSMPTSALNGPVAIDSLNQIVDSVDHGDYTIRWTPNPSPYTFSVPDKSLYWVGIYDSVWMPGDPLHASYNGHTLPDSNCTSLNTRWWTGCGTTGVWFDNETGNTTQGADNTYHSWNVDNAHGTGVPIVYIEPDNPNTLYYWFYQGYDDSEGYDPCPGYDYCMDYTFTGVDKDVATKWTLMVAVTCAQDGNVTFNGNPLPNGYDVNSAFYDVAINDVTGMVNDGDNTVGLRTDDMYFHPYWMWLVGETVAGAPPVAGFTANVTTGPAPLAVHFTDTSSGEITSRKWDFDNNGEIDSTDQHPDYTYTDPGVYTVRLNVTGPDGSDEEIKVDYITVTEWIPSTPFFISGWVNNSAGEPVNNPVVNITNTRTSEVFTAETIADSNYYQVLTCSENVSAGDVLHFTAIAETTTEFDHEVTAADMNRGGFEQNITIEKTPRPDLVITIIDAYHNKTLYPSSKYPPCFNLSNEIDVTVENAGSKDANSSHVSLYIDSEFRGKQSVPALDVGCNATVQFKWTPEGYDCEDEGTSITYTLQAVADCDNEIDESNEGNNESTVQESAYWAGYSADEVLSTAFHGTIHGGLNFTTGDGVYTPLGSPGASTDIHYDITLPAGASVELARLNVYYTWGMTDTTGVYPSMEVSITNASGGPYTLSTDKECNDRPCDSPAITYDYPFGNYVYDITDYVNGSGSYTVTVKNNGPTEHSFAIDPPGLVILYNDSTKPEYEYWILEGADILQGGRRGGSGNLALSECINNATFEGTIDLNKMESATLGLATPWGGNPTDVRHSYLYFNGNELGKDVYHGYGVTYSETLNGMSMYIGSTTAQMGVNLTDVTSCLAASNNVVGQGDDGDSMLVANAFLLVERMDKKDDVANAEKTVSGTRTGSYEDTHVSDDVYEAITEIESKGNPVNRYSYLEHNWTIDVTGGSEVIFYVEAYHSQSSDGDNFVFAYSIDGSTYTDMVTVTKIEDDDMHQTCNELPSDLSGTVYIRVKDTDQTVENKILDTIYIDHMFIRSVFGASDTTPPAAVTDLAAGDPTSSAITLTWTAPGDDGTTGTANLYDIRYSTSTITDVNWDSATQCTDEPAPQPAGSSETFTVTGLDANTTYYFALKTSDEVPNESPLSNVASNTTKEASPNTMHVASIDMSTTRYQDKGWYTYATATVTVVDSAGEPVGSATVEGHWSGLTSDTDSGPTGSDGKVALNSDSVKNAAGTFTFTVDNVAKEGWTYNSTANLETQDSISV